MSLAIICPNRDVSDWVAALQTHDSSLLIEVWPDIGAPEQVEFVLCWNHPRGVLRQFPRLKCISSLGAGVNHLLNDPTCPPGIPLVRVVDASLKQSMAEYVMLGVLEHLRSFKSYDRQQTVRKWKMLPVTAGSEIGIGLLGCGQLGQYVGKRLADFGFKVYGWCRTPKKMAAIEVYSGKSGFAEFFARANILVCLLPLTSATENILNQETFKLLPESAYLINVARGAHLVDEELLTALDSGQLSGALLDVFREEPLPRHHPFWTHKKISMTPHIASLTNPTTAAGQVVENYHRAVKGEPLINLVDVQLGY